MVPIKNTEGLLRAFVKYFEKERDAELVMVGDTDIKIRTLANELGLSSRISFRGEVPYSQVATEMQAANCLVMFSNMENSPCVIGEALCCGLPVIATNVGGIPELIDEGNGMLIDPQDEAGLVTALHQMKDRYTKFDRASIAQRANAKFSYPVIGKKFDEIYSEMIERT
jgi:glycosyltransferase involved in cell wall biosynthesis